MSIFQRRRPQAASSLPANAPQVRGLTESAVPAGASPALADPVSVDSLYAVRWTPDVTPGDFEPPFTQPSPDGVKESPLQVSNAVGLFVEPHPTAVALLPSGRAPGVELAGYRAPRHVGNFENAAHRSGIPDWQPNNGRVMVSRGPLADEGAYYDPMLSGWYGSSGVSTAPTLNAPGPQAVAAETRSTNTPWEAQLMTDGGAR